MRGSENQSDVILSGTGVSAAFARKIHILVFEVNLLLNLRAQVCIRIHKPIHTYAHVNAL